ncbi:hypothetical protein PN36_05695 [Candidatus Thiomargarita nelsonii]|uniref:H-type lectin domain-containing protein n=1 Tax=Candidatus Thiomargarita nelsonii TaxID=1003181 RepID=A0A4E0QSJ6_9GAMM|nr:hypothetical protein PN36_05695 [Candidatus Thiomargarita nelsonii]
MKLRENCYTRGILNKRVNFKRKFQAAPVVMLSLIFLDIIEGNNHRIRVNVKQVDKRGFSYEFVTWCNTKVYRARAQWTAIGQ